MTDYVFVDGPLAGQATSLTTEGIGDAILVEVAGYDEDLATVPGFTYVVDTGPTVHGVGQLRFLDTGSTGEQASKGSWSLPRT